jgi:SAM-dependent methyltransferase
MLTAEQQQTQHVFDEKWRQVRRWSPAYVERNSLPWLARKYNLQSVDELREMVRGKQRILDGGCGLGYTLQFFAQTNPSAEIVGYDFSPEAVKYASEGVKAFPNVRVVEASHLSVAEVLPNDHFDLVQSEGTVMCSGDPALAVKNLGRLLAPGGTLMVHVYRKMGPVREATDDALMKVCRDLGDFEKMWDFSRFFTAVAEKLYKARDENGQPLTITCRHSWPRRCSVRRGRSRCSSSCTKRSSRSCGTGAVGI